MPETDEGKKEIQASDNTKQDSGSTEKRMLVPSLAIAGLAVSMPVLVLTLLTVDIAIAFEVPVGVAAQLNSFFSASGVVFALLMGWLVVRFRHKYLLLVGISLVVMASVLAFFAPSLMFMESAYVLAGGGAVMVNVMSLTIVGEHLPANRKAKAVSYLFAFASLAYVIGIPLIGVATDLGGWKTVFLYLLLPITAASLLMSVFSLPSTPQKQSSPAGRTGFLSSLRQVFSNRSAAACLVGTIVIAAGSMSFGIFAVAYYREYFLMPRDFGTAVLIVISALFVVASLIAGRIVNMVGGRNMTALSYLITGVFSIAFFFGPSLWICLALNLVHASSWAAGSTAYRCLVMDQVPRSRGTLFSLNDVFTSVGVAIGAAVGGALLVAFSYQAVGLVYGALCLAGVAIYFFGVRDSKEHELTTS